MSGSAISNFTHVKKKERKKETKDTTNSIGLLRNCDQYLSLMSCFLHIFVRVGLSKDSKNDRE